MNIAIIGAGNVGGTLGTRWAQRGHHVIYGVRNPADAKYAPLLTQAGVNAAVASITDAVAGAGVVLLATPWDATQSAIQSVSDWSGKVLIDATNPLAASADFLDRGLLVGQTTSGGEQVQAWARGAQVVKAFNTIGAEVMADPRFGAVGATLLICGDDDDAKATVIGLANGIGFEPVDAGPLSMARLLEPHAMLWIQLCIARGWGPNFAFHVERR